MTALFWDSFPLKRIYLERGGGHELGHGANMGHFHPSYVCLVYFLRKSTEFNANKRRSVKEFSFISYFLFYHNSCDHCTYSALLTKRPDAPNISPSTILLSCRGADLAVQRSSGRKSSKAEGKGKRENSQAAADREKKKWNRKDEESNRGREDAVAPSSG